MGKTTHDDKTTDAKAVREGAQIRNVGESSGAKQSASHQEMAKDFMTAIQGLHKTGGIKDIFHKMPKRTGASWHVKKSPTRRSSSK